MKFNTFKLLTVVNAFIMQIAFCLCALKANFNTLDTYGYATEVDSDRRFKRYKSDLFHPVYTPMILAGDKTHELSIQSYGTFFTRKMFSPRNQHEADGW